MPRKKKPPAPTPARMGRPRVYSDRTVISSIGIERRLLAELDKRAAKHGLTRSQAIAAAVEAWLQLPN